MKAKSTVLQLTIIVTILLMIFVTACQKQIFVEQALPDLGLEQYDYESLNIPAGVNVSDNTPFDNPITNAGAALGRVLFYDKGLSLNEKTACASCHLQSSSFSDLTASSTGFINGKTGRNTPMILNARFHVDFLWDARAKTLEEQVLMPIRDHLEMGMDNTDHMEMRIQAIPHYPKLFEDAFGSGDITTVRISRALAQFVRSIASFNSKWDQGAGSNWQNFTFQETQGQQIFNNDCATCHTPGVFGGQRVANIGLDMIYSDNGVGDLTGNFSENGIFKVPSLRNIELTAPYMHDGRFNSLEDVVAHYNQGIQNHLNLDQTFLPGGSGGYSGGGGGGTPIVLGLSKTEEDALVSFLKTLTDVSILSDPKFSDPMVP